MQTTVNVASYNVWLLKIDVLCLELGGKAVDERVTPLGRFLGPRLNDFTHDVLILQEAFMYNEILKEIFEHCPDLQVSGPIPAEESPSHPKCFNGGVMILTRHRIVDQSYTAFTDAASEDKHGAKGVVYAEIQFNDRSNAPNMHVFGTHLQADSEYAHIRTKQMHQMRAFIDDVMLSKKRDEPVVLAGDFNIDRISPQYAEMRRTLEAWHGRIVGIPTSDMNNDWKRKEGATKSEYLDYIMLSTNPRHQQPAFVGRHEAERVQGRVPGYGYTDLADHHLVNTQYIFQPKLSTEHKMEKLTFKLKKGDEKTVAKLSKRRVAQFWVENNGPASVEMKVLSLDGAYEIHEVAAGDSCYLEVGSELRLRVVDGKAQGKFGVYVHPLEPHIE